MLTYSVDSAVITSLSDMIELAATGAHSKQLLKFNLLLNGGSESVNCVLVLFRFVFVLFRTLLFSLQVLLESFLCVASCFPRLCFCNYAF